MNFGEQVLFGVDLREVDEATLHDCIVKAGRAFDASPTTMHCVLPARAGDIQWFTFRASSLGGDTTMADGFFEDGFNHDELPFVTASRDWISESAVVIKRYVGGKTMFVVASDGTKVGITGHVDRRVPRTGDAEQVALTALGWQRPIPWAAIDTTARRIVLRANAKVVAKPKIVAGGRALPRVKVRRAFGPIAKIADGTYAEVFAVHRAAPAAELVPATRRAKAAAKPVKLKVSIGRRGNWIDLSTTTAITGSIGVYDSCDGDDAFGIPVVDLGAVREAVYPFALSIEGVVERVTAPALVRADSISIEEDAEAQLDFPVLEELRYGRFALPFGNHRRLVLPALATVKMRLVIDLAHDRPFEIRLPKLVSARVAIKAPRLSDATVAKSVLEAPALPPQDLFFVDAAGGKLRGFVPKAKVAERVYSTSQIAALLEATGAKR